MTEAMTEAPPLQLFTTHWKARGKAAEIRQFVASLVPNTPTPTRFPPHDGARQLMTLWGRENGRKIVTRTWGDRLWVCWVVEY